MNRQTFMLIENHMQSCMRDAAHDKEHVYRVLHNAVRITQSEPSANGDVIIAAALLHDISRPEQLADPRVNHALHGAEKAYIFLLAQGFPTAFCAHVRDCIRTHRFRKSEPPTTLEARIIFDADKLDVAGAIGIARTLQYNGETGRPIYTRDKNGHISDGTEDTQDSFCKEYKFKLENICEHFLTEAGRALALSRHDAAKAYYAALMSEVRDDMGQAALDGMLTDE